MPKPTPKTASRATRPPSEGRVVSHGETTQLDARIIASQLAARAKLQGRTHAEIAEATGIARPNISTYLAGRKAMRLETLIEIARALDVEIVVHWPKVAPRSAD